jgi:hypothetical protein
MMLVWVRRSVILLVDSNNSQTYRLHHQSWYVPAYLLGTKTQNENTVTLAAVETSTLALNKKNLSWL